MNGNRQPNTMIVENFDNSICDILIMLFYKRSTFRGNDTSIDNMLDLLAQMENASEPW